LGGRGGRSGTTKGKSAGAVGKEKRAIPLIREEKGGDRKNQLELRNKLGQVPGGRHGREGGVFAQAGGKIAKEKRRVRQRAKLSGEEK